MKAGRYYIGDPCYVIGRGEDSEWLDLLEATNFFDGEVYDYKGHKIWGHGTMHGDGEYQDNMGNSYPVDAGLLSCIPVEAMDVSEEYVAENGLGVIHDFKEDFGCDASGGLLRMGPVVIDTDPFYDEPDTY
jgi:hypothetical protein